MGKSAAAIETEIQEALDGCRSLRAIGLWFKMQQLIKKSPNPGRLEIDGKPVTLPQLAGYVGPKATREQVHALIGTLSRVRVGDEPLVQWIQPDQDTRVLFSGPQARVDRERARVAAAAAVSRSKAGKPAKALHNAGKALHNATPKKTTGETSGEALHNATSALHNAVGFPPSPPPLSSPPTTPSPILTSLSPPFLFPAAAQAGGDAVTSSAPEHKPDTRKPRRPLAVRKTTPEQQATKEAFDAWYIQHGFPSTHHGVEYPAYDAADAAAVWKILKAREIGWDLERAKELAIFYLKQPEVYNYSGHRIREMGNRLGHLLTQLAQSKKGHYGTNGKTYGQRTAAPASRSKFDQQLPVGSQNPDDLPD